MAASKSAKTSSSYYSDKKKLIKWILIYLVIGALIYAAIYFFIVNSNGGSSSGSTLPFLYFIIFKFPTRKIFLNCWGNRFRPRDLTAPSPAPQIDAPYPPNNKQFKCIR